MSATEQAVPSRGHYHPAAYAFVLEALEYAQKLRDQKASLPATGVERHVTGSELLDGFRQCAYEKFGGLALTVFHQWGLNGTSDVGQIVWELIERGNLRKTEEDQISDFDNVYDFREIFDRQYPVDVSFAFGESRD